MTRKIVVFFCILIVVFFAMNALHIRYNFNPFAPSVPTDVELYESKKKVASTEQRMTTTTTTARTICVIMQLGSSFCEIETIYMVTAKLLQMANSISRGNKNATRIVVQYKNIFHLKSNQFTPSTALCTDKNGELNSETDYLFFTLHSYKEYEAYFKFFEREQMKKYPNTKRVKYLVSDEHCLKTNANDYEKFDAVFRNYWCDGIESLNRTLKNIYYMPLLTCYPFVSLTPRIVPSIKQQMNAIVPSSQRKIFCLFRGNKNPVRKQLEKMPKHILDMCKIEYNNKFNTGVDKLTYSLELQSGVFIFCPTGQNVEQFRIWESLESGAIPIIQNGPTFQLTKFFKDSPIFIVNVTKEKGWHNNEELFQFLTYYYNNTDKLDLYQKRVYQWWLKKREAIQERILNEFIPK